MHRAIATVFPLAVLVVVASGCTSSNSPTNEASTAGRSSNSSLTIGMMPKLVGISYFDATKRGAQEAAAELGVKLVYDGPTDATSDEQAKMVDGWAAQGFDVIAIAPNDPEAISKTLRDAADSGSKVLTWDTDANPPASGRLLFVNQAPNDAIAQALVDVMAAGVKSRGQEVKGKYLIVSGTPTAANQNTWMQIMRDYIARSYPDVQLLTPLTPGEDQRKAQEQTAEAITANPDLKGIWGITSVALPAAAKAARDARKAQSIYVTGLSLPSLMQEFIADGTVEKFVLWDAVDLGYLTVHVAARLHKGAIEPGRYDWGRLKGVEVRDGQAILGPPLVFDRENIGRYRF